MRRRCSSRPSCSPGSTSIEWLAALDMLAGECPTPTAVGVARYLFDDGHFVGNRTAYYDWRNSCLDRVIATRTGIPISLSVLMIEVARRVGVKLVGVGMPTHFLVGVAGDPEVFFDPFTGGRRLDRAQARGPVRGSDTPAGSVGRAATSTRRRTVTS